MYGYLCKIETDGHADGRIRGCSHPSLYQMETKGRMATIRTQHMERQARPPAAARARPAPQGLRQIPEQALASGTARPSAALCTPRSHLARRARQDARRAAPRAAGAPSPEPHCSLTCRSAPPAGAASPARGAVAHERWLPPVQGLRPAQGPPHPARRAVRRSGARVDVRWRSGRAPARPHRPRDALPARVRVGDSCWGEVSPGWAGRAERRAFRQWRQQAVRDVAL